MDTEIQRASFCSIYIQIDNDAISDINNNYFIGINKNEYSFISEDYDEPEIINVVPSYNLIIEEITVILKQRFLI